MSEQTREVMRMSCIECCDGKPIRMVDRPHHAGAPCTTCDGSGSITRGSQKSKAPSLKFFTEFLTDSDVWVLRVFVNSTRALSKNSLKRNMWDVDANGRNHGTYIVAMLLRLGLLEEFRDPRNRTDEPDFIITQLGKYVFANITKLDPKFLENEEYPYPKHADEEK